MVARIRWARKSVVVVFLFLAVCGFEVIRAFECFRGCVIPDTFLNDGFCDCSDCGDESEFTCDLCPGCPSQCGDSVQCAIFKCIDGCQIPGFQVDDGFCDCSDCADEPAFTCDSCPGCPESCGNYTICVEPTSTTAPNSTDFNCTDGCQIAESKVDDGNCDCSDCDDESAFTCESCPGCPESCGNYTICTELTNSTDFNCTDGCQIPEYKVDDGNCDCSDCDDESAFSCHSCPGCPESCGNYTICMEPTSTIAPITPTPTVFPVFECTDGCQIPEAYLNDDWCDCSDCGDESAFSCDSCPGCPVSCGNYTICDVPTTTTFFALNSTENTKDNRKLSDYYYCVDVSDLAPWWYIACATLFQFWKVMTFVRGILKNEKEAKPVAKGIVLLFQIIAFVRVFATDTLRFLHKGNGLNLWEQYTCFAEIWMFSSNLMRFSAMLVTMSLFLEEFQREVRICCVPNTKSKNCLCLDAILVITVLPTAILYAPICVTHVLPMAVVYCWFLIPGVFLLIFIYVSLVNYFEELEDDNFNIPFWLTLLLGTVLLMFSAGLAFNIYRTGDYWQSLKVVFFERKIKEYLSSKPMPRLILKAVIWLF